MDQKVALEAIDSYVSAHANEVVAFLQEFIAIRSVTYEEGDAVSCFAGKLKAFGVDEVRIDAVGNALGRVGERYIEDLNETVQFSLEPKRYKTIQPPLKMEYCGRVDLLIRRVEVCDMLGLFRLPVPKKNGGATADGFG